MTLKELVEKIERLGREGTADRVREAVGGMPKPPCDLGCTFKQQCAEEELACLSFFHYTQRGRSTREVERQEKHLPDREIYLRLFPNTEGRR